MSTPKEQLLEELEPLANGESVIDALAVAIAVEDTFGIVLSDADLAPEHLCSPAALGATVNRYLGDV